MPAPQNAFKAAMKSGQPQMGCWVGLADAYTAEITASAGFDWLLIDCEHAPNDLRSMMAQLTVVEASGSKPVVRVPIGETWMIKQFLDAGAQTLLVPMVESKAQAEDLVSAVRYPPVGVRGVGSALARASHFSAISDYLTTADSEICLLVQVENRAGLVELDAILSVEGVDGVFIGPSDLAADMGHLGDPMHPEVVAVILDALKRIKAAGKAPGILTTNFDFARACLELGATFVATSIDVTLYAAAIRGAARQAKELLGSVEG
ncbi:HpcH/HpaI aldolase [Stappia aggregata IAM 12614]|uniref:HpcH/HpaI aldolase n=1 Tax=Roseibium aggregatum (strain ATCC 25650 / DSM 13394 / JCM 20685 / NBRC 16684 / NCIMB 2208 / IAM 12614 / B1) TaxID=384765 RepID=A0NXS0_ROSAI|nr:4-hydroxy-2-oxoheptanedioate aldolase [Roseibium aggregatum]EAV42264.1 HpcH/HpaI aldolase [Stappia aggregata IAM 12614] [Roseibium aggregatum IAM 12614]